MTFDEALKQHLADFVKNIIEASRRAGQEASGRTYRNIKSSSKRWGNDFHGEITAPVYFHTLIHGRRPRPVPANMADIIEDWAAAKGIFFATRKAARRFAVNVAKKLEEEGSRLYRNHQYLDIFDTPQEIFEEWLSKEIDAIITRNIAYIFTQENTTYNSSDLWHL